MSSFLTIGQKLDRNLQLLVVIFFCNMAPFDAYEAFALATSEMTAGQGERFSMEFRFFVMPMSEKLLTFGELIYLRKGPPPLHGCSVFDVPEELVNFR